MILFMWWRFLLSQFLQKQKKLELLNDIATIDIFHSFNEKKQLAEQGYWSYVFDYIQVNINRCRGDYYSGRNFSKHSHIHLTLCQSCHCNIFYCQLLSHNCGGRLNSATDMLKQNKTVCVAHTVNNNQLAQSLPYVLVNCHFFCLCLFVKFQLRVWISCGQCSNMLLFWVTVAALSQEL